MYLRYALMPVLTAVCLLLPACAWGSEPTAPVAQRTITGRPDFPE